MPQDLIPQDRSVLNQSVRVLSTREKIAVELFLQYGQIDAILAVTDKSLASTWSRQELEALAADPYIQKEISTRQEQIELATAQFMAKSNKLTPEFLKAHVVENIQDAEPGSEKTKALELGFVIAGVMSKGTLAEKPAKDAQSPIYRALQTTTVRRTIEEVTQTQELPAGPATLELPAIIPEEDVVILDYETGKPVK